MAQAVHNCSQLGCPQGCPCRQEHSWAVQVLLQLSEKGRREAVLGSAHTPCTQPGTGTNSPPWCCYLSLVTHSSMKHSPAVLTTSGVQGKVCGGSWSSRDRTALRKLWRITKSRSRSIRGGKAEGDESWGMVLPPTCFTTPCKER